MRQIALTQYMMPNGEQKITGMNVPDIVADKADLITEAGFELTCEMLRTGEIAFYITKDKDTPDCEELDCRIAQNGPGEHSPVKVLTKMIEEFKIREALA